MHVHRNQCGPDLKVRVQKQILYEKLFPLRVNKYRYEKIIEP